MLLDHELDAAPVHRALQKGTNIIDRSTQNRGTGGDWSKIKPLFPDIFAEGARFVKQHGYVPASHSYVIRGDIHEKYPWLPSACLRRFRRPKRPPGKRSRKPFHRGCSSARSFWPRAENLVGNDPFTYGVIANRKMIGAMIDASYEQGLTARKLTVEELFAASTLEL